MKTIKNIISAVCLAIIAIALILWLILKPKTETRNIAVFVPGIIDNSPVYAMLADGVSKGIETYNQANEAKIKLSIIEAGTNQAEWASKLTALASTQKYELIISSNPSLPDLAVPLTKQYPNQKFIILDSYYADNPNIATFQFNQREQAYLAGYAAGLATIANKERMEYANPSKKIAIIAAQEYPVMNNIILPGFTEGAKAVDSEIEVLFRVVGNWYDANKGSDIARSLYSSGVDVVLPICGGASQGVISAAKELGFYLIWFDDNGFSKAPRYVISSCTMEQSVLAKEATLSYLNNDIDFGKARILGIEDGYVNLVTEDPLFKKTLDVQFQNNLINVFDKIKSKEIILTSPIL